MLIAQFENRTGESVFDGTLEYALERELSNSRYVNVVPRPRIDDTLQLMRRSLDTALTPTVAREVALRDGGIRALLTGRVEKLDMTYLLSAALVEPSGGVTVASFSEEAEGQKQVVPALRQLSYRVRETLGEKLSLIQESEQKLEKGTTPSLRALQLYSQGIALVNPLVGVPRWGPAAEFFQQAVAEDPEFASAHIWLAHSFHNLNKKEEEDAHYQRAFALAATTSDLERYFILGSYYFGHANELDKAAQAFEVLVQLYPDHFWGNLKLAQVYRRQERTQDAVPYSLRLAELYPNNFVANVRAAFALVTWANNLDQARPYIQRARKLLSREWIHRSPGWSVWARLFPAREHFYKGELEEALNEATLVAEILKSPGRKTRTRTIYAWWVGSLYVDLGKLRAAEETFQHISVTRSRHLALAKIADARGDMPALREHMKKVAATGKNVGSFETTYFVSAGLLAAAERGIENMEERKKVSPKSAITCVRGHLALARGQTAEAILLFQKGIEQLGDDSWTARVKAAESLAGIWERQGHLPRAIQVLEATSQEKKRSIFGGGGYTWMRVQMRLAQLYRKVGREEEAQKIEAELLKLLAYADPDHPLLRQLRATQALAAAQSPN
ncbi:MAG: tetratricopeptide repeat protein [Candidatus Acidoferrales bacterium]